MLTQPWWARTASFPGLPCLIPRPSLSYSQAFPCLIPRPFLSHSQAFPVSFPGLSCLIPRSSPVSSFYTYSIIVWWTALLPVCISLIPRPHPARAGVGFGSGTETNCVYAYLLFKQSTGSGGIKQGSRINWQSFYPTLTTCKCWQIQLNSYI